MKKAFWVLAAAVLTTSALCSEAPAADEKATLLFSAGEVRVKSKYGAWVPAASGQKVDWGTLVRVGEGAPCDLVIGAEKNVLRLEPGTVLEVRSLDPPLFEMNEGSLFAQIKKLKKGTRFEVKTPTAIASVRGTGWRQSLDQIQVFEGVLRVVGTDVAIKEIDLQAGYEVAVSEVGVLAEPEPMEETDEAGWKRFMAGTDDSLTDDQRAALLEAAAKLEEEAAAAAEAETEPEAEVPNEETPSE